MSMMLSINISGCGDARLKSHLRDNKTCGTIKLRINYKNSVLKTAWSKSRDIRLINVIKYYEGIKVLLSWIAIIAIKIIICGHAVA